MSEIEQIIDQLERQNAELSAEHERLLSHAREVRGSRDVHSVYEVLDWQQDQNGKLLARVAELEQEAADEQKSFDLRWEADMRAIKRWQAAHPGREDTWPDHADLVVWLMEQVSGLEERLGKLILAEVERSDI